MICANDCMNVTSFFPSVKIFSATVCIGQKSGVTFCNALDRNVKKSVTIKDVARETGVHVATVSRALSPNARALLSAEVVAKIRETANAMGYRPNRIAAGLRTRRTMTVGVMIPDITNTLFPPIVRGMEAALEPAGYASILVNTDNDPDREARLFDVLLQRGVDGIIDAAVTHMDPHLERISREVPIVTANRMVEGSGIPSVINDDAGGIRMMLQKLHAAGHRNIGHIAGPEDLSTGIQRREAFQAAANGLGLKVPGTAMIVAERYNEDEGSRCAMSALENSPDVTALLCANDRLAIGAIDALASLGLKCPEDISVTGFNDIPFLDMIPPGLTTVQILQFDVGRIAAEILLKRMTEPDARVPETTIMPVSIIERNSIAPPRSGRGRKTRASRQSRQKKLE